MKQCRLSVILERPLLRSVKQLAVRDGVSVSRKAGDLIQEVLEIYENKSLVEPAKAHIATIGRSKALAHGPVAAHVKKRRR